MKNDTGIDVSSAIRQGIRANGMCLQNIENPEEVFQKLYEYDRRIFIDDEFRKEHPSRIEYMESIIRYKKKEV